MCRRRLVEAAEKDLSVAGQLFEKVDAHSALASELDALLAHPATPLLAVLPSLSRPPPAVRALIEVSESNLALWKARSTSSGGPP